MAKLVVRLKAIGIQASRAVPQALVRTADDIVSMAKQLAPVDTGSLRSSYMFSAETPSKVVVGSLAGIVNPKSGRPATEYAAYVEYGTSQSPAQPHFIPAFAQARETFEARLREALETLA